MSKPTSEARRRNVQDEQDSKVKFNYEHEGADEASGANEGEAQAVKRDVRRAE